MNDLKGAGLNGPAQKIYYTLRIASAMCFLGHGVFGVICKPIWCNYFGVFGIGHDLAFRLMPVVGAMDILMGISLLIYPLRAVAGWLVCWGFVTATLRPLSGEPFGELIERAGNFGAPLVLLLLSPSGPKGWMSRIDPVPRPNAPNYKRVILCLRIIVFLLLLGHGWLNLNEKKALLEQYASLGFDNPATTAHFIGVFEIAAAFTILLRPLRWLVGALFIWKMTTELFYPHWAAFEWIERGGSYGSILALWFALGGLDIKIFTTKTTVMKKAFFILVCLAGIAGLNRASAQGCVAIRSNGGFCTAGDEAGHVDTSAQWQLSLNNRYYKSFRHYVGATYQKQRQVLGNEVINNAYTMDLAIYRILNPRWSIMLDVPVSANARSQTYKQNGIYNRFSTHAFGAGDIRFAVYRWLLDPVKMPKGNVQMGLGL
ncbi:MAG TPA: DoxX family protein, partial [Puia sp.]|nr:DoxX family protein [Puia sp.]